MPVGYGEVCKMTKGCRRLQDSETVKESWHGQPGLWWIGRRQVAIKVKGNKPRPTARLSLPDPLSKLARAAGGFGW
ncbi:Os06g0353050 [Oryza sativa Japonica Group]|uniref:Os06g0353050 protein n=1 Tax=Oryza sativa subsp. japonica TaxID=39947 RepID=A0A0P0WWV2_ORYSJ|nr:Os06g0353050 [Oryza sativa Japonica Group]